MIAIVSTFLLFSLQSSLGDNPLSIAFPSSWDGDKYTEAKCAPNSKLTIPTWLNGYFLGQISASFGNQSDPTGQKLTHMFDGQGAVASFHLRSGDVRFSARYYPTRAYKIWDFYDRNMAQSKVAWYTFASTYNETALNQWEPFKVSSQLSSNPNVDFWKVGTSVIGGTEYPTVGYTFDVAELKSFKIFDFKETSDIFGSGSKIMFLNMPIHERLEPNGALWASVAGRDYANSRMYQFLFTVSPDKVRTVVANYSYGTYDFTLCHNGSYAGDMSVFPGYMHSITSTENYVILPLTSFLLSVCRPVTLVDPALEGNVRFLVFDKRSKMWATEKPIDFQQSLFITHQMNAYESNGKLIADMISFDDNVYAKLIVTEVEKPDFLPFKSRFLRFTLDLNAQTAVVKNLLDDDYVDAEFPQFNHNFEGKFYKWIYFVYRPFKLQSAIYKLNVQSMNPQVMNFTAGPDVSLGEPWFVQNPGKTGEDDGVLLVRGLNTSSQRSQLYVINASTMQLTGYASAPTAIPFGLHNRYYSSADLGIDDEVPDSSGKTKISPSLSISLFFLVYLIT